LKLLGLKLLDELGSAVFRQHVALVPIRIVVADWHLPIILALELHLLLAEVHIGAGNPLVGVNHHRLLLLMLLLFQTIDEVKMRV
jgi:hypothetical protein